VSIERVATVELPLRGETSVRAAVLADGLHVLATGVTPARSAHLLIDASAQVVSELGPIALSIAEIAAGVDELLVSGDDHEGRLVLAAIDARGNERWRTYLATAAPLTRAPLPLIAGSHAAVVWEESDDERSTLAVCDVHDRACGPVRRIDLPDTTHRLDAVMTNAGIIVARLAGFPPSLTLMRIADGKVVVQRELPEAGRGPIAIARAGDGIVIAWVRAGEVHARSFDAHLQPLGERRRLHNSGVMDRLSGHEGAPPAFVATRWNGKPHAREGQATSELLFDDGACAVPLPIGWVETGGWIGDTFVLVHGDVDIAASAFTRAGA
jgi:hypothetical protein